MKVFEIVLLLHEIGGSKGSHRFTFAGYFRGDALGQLADGAPVNQQICFGLSQHVNESGSNDQAGSIDRALRFYIVGSMADESNAIADDSQIGIEPRIAGAIDNLSIANQGVVLLRKSRNCKKDSEDNQQEFKFHRDVWTAARYQNAIEKQSLVQTDQS